MEQYSLNGSWNMAGADGLEVRGQIPGSVYSFLLDAGRMKDPYYRDLEIDALNKEPGIYSARYMGEDTSYRIKNANLIERLAGVPDEKRTARFVCAVAAAFPDGNVKVVRETMEGRIAYAEAGRNGFGYDPIFFLPEYGCTSAELSREEKHRISHRGKALRAIKAYL